MMSTTSDQRVLDLTRREYEERLSFVVEGMSAYTIHFVDGLTLGNSISGLWSALIAADHFENVLIIEPEAWVFTEEEGRSNTYNEKGVYIENSRQHTRSRVVQYHAHHGEQNRRPMGLP